MLDSGVLVLNRLYQPIHVTSVKRAFALLYQGIARAIDREYRLFDFQSWAALSAEAHPDSVAHGQPPHPHAAGDRAGGLRAPAAGAGALLAPQHLPARRQPLPVLRQPVSAAPS